MFGDSDQGWEHGRGGCGLVGDGVGDGLSNHVWRVSEEQEKEERGGEGKEMRGGRRTGGIVEMVDRKEGGRNPEVREGVRKIEGEGKVREWGRREG